MDLVKTGKYIAGKRKELGLTQKQLAETLGMSDKSVSKWERGVCLPDVSVYLELCKILGISINEFLSGEDISEENMIMQSENNLLQLTKDSGKRQKKLKRTIAVLTVILFIVLFLSGVNIYRRISRPKNYIVSVEQDSVEMKTAELLSGADGAFLYRYFTKDDFCELEIYMSEYIKGKLNTKTKIVVLSYADIDSPEEGMLVLIPEFDQYEIRVIAADNYAKYSTSVPVLENVENREYYGRSATQVEDELMIQYDTEQGLAAFLYGENGVSAIPVLDIDNETLNMKNDYVYYFSFRFKKT